MIENLWNFQLKILGIFVSLHRDFEVTCITKGL